MPVYRDFTITVNGGRGAYTVEARGPDEIGVPPAPLDWPVSYFTEFERIQAGEAPTRAQMQELGTRLFDALLPRRVARALSRSYDELPASEALRLKLAIRPPELNILPWELLYDPDEEIFLAARLTSPIVRLVESGIPQVGRLARHPLRILYIQSTPSDLPTLDMAASEEALRSALGEQAEITTIRAATPAALRQAIRQPYHILHYDGHALFDAEAQTGYLCLEDESGNTHTVSSEMLAATLDGSSLRLVVLAACQSGMDSGRKRFAGIAQQLMKSSNLPAAIAMQFSVPDSAAIAFTTGFYAGLADGYPVDAAVTEGRKAILETQGGDPFGSPDWATPVLFLRTQNSAIFDTETETALMSQEKTSPNRNDETPRESASGGIHIGTGATIHGDVFTGSKKTGVSIGSINNVSGGQLNIAGGDIHQGQPATGEMTIGQAFDRLAEKLNSMPEGPGKMMANTAVQGLKAEADKGEQAEEKNVDQWFSFLAQMAPDVLEVAAATFVNPIAGLGMAFKKIAEKASSEKTKSREAK